MPEERRPRPQPRSPLSAATAGGGASPAHGHKCHGPRRSGSPPPRLRSLPTPVSVSVPAPSPLTFSCPAGPERSAARSSAGRRRCRAPLPPAPPAPALPPPSQPASRPPSPPAAPGTRCRCSGARRTPRPLPRQAQPSAAAPSRAGQRRGLRRGQPGCRVTAQPWASSCPPGCSHCSSNSWGNREATSVISHSFTSSLCTRCFPATHLSSTQGAREGNTVRDAARHIPRHSTPRSSRVK